MLAAAYHNHGAPAEVVSVQRVPVPPAPAAGQLLVRVRAASLNPADWKSGAGEQKLLLGFKWPRVYGFDFSGEVVTVGPGTACGFKEGEEVFGMIRGLPEAGKGTVAEYCIVDADVCARKPKMHTAPHVVTKKAHEPVAHTAAASLPLVGITAVKMFRACGLVERSLHTSKAPSQAVAAQQHMKVLITGGAGGVGSIAIQLAKKLYNVGHVTATASPGDKTAVCQRLGADVVVNYKQRGWAQELPDHFDAILDCTGEASSLVHLLKKASVPDGARKAGMCSILAGPTQAALLTWMEEAKLDPARVTFGVHGFLHSSLGGGCAFELFSGATLLRRACAKRNATFAHIIGTGNGEIVQTLATLLERRDIEAVVDTVYPLARAVDAIERQKTGRALGKVVVETSGKLGQVVTPNKLHPYTPSWDVAEEK
eukprot:TRINITY_DN11024_c0_g1_i1.p1 TRINITY_DN11024_c0_g1~~TRINITY_DN11024_c0_g1_i1.p1  ORF type:complete len:465 (+),score=156.86 TRINITY_DN11024_c0_g1_i1:120-1397(+)